MHESRGFVRRRLVALEDLLDELLILLREGLEITERSLVGGQRMRREPTSILRNKRQR